MIENASNTQSTSTSDECAAMRKRIFDDPLTIGGINGAWELSQATATHPKREQGGLFGKVNATGNTVDSAFPRQGNEQGSLKGFGVWAQRKMRQSRDLATYEFWYHTHPHEPGEEVPGEGMAIQPEFPTGRSGDIGVSEDLNLLGILITKKRISVFDKNGIIRCYWDRYLVDFDPRGQIMKSRLLVYAIVVGLNLQCSYSGNKARDMSGNKSDSETRTAQSEDNLELKRRHEVMESEIQSASKKLAIEALKEIHGTDEIRVWVGFGITQPRLFVMRLLNGREASFHTARTSRQGSTTVLDVPEKTILGPPKSGWAEFENFLKAQGIESAMRLSPESSSYRRSPDVQILPSKPT